MNNATSAIKVGMAKLKITNDYQLADKIGLSRQALSRKMITPSTFKPKEIIALAELFGWSNEELGEFMRAL